jgi:hypothetical protein
VLLSFRARERTRIGNEDARGKGSAPRIMCRRRTCGPRGGETRGRSGGIDVRERREGSRRVGAATGDRSDACIYFCVVRRRRRGRPLAFIRSFVRRAPEYRPARPRFEPPLGLFMRFPPPLRTRSLHRGSHARTRQPGAREPNEDKQLRNARVREGRLQKRVNILINHLHGPPLLDAI